MRKIPPPLAPLFLCLLTASSADAATTWSTVDARGSCSLHQEAALAALDGTLYLIGGRGDMPVDVFDPDTGTWTEGARPPFQMHHFQARVLGERIAVIGGFTGDFPHEDPIPDIWFYTPATDSWEKGPEIPEGRRRGAAGAVVNGDHVYLVGGIVNGHWDGCVPWLDRWNWKTGEWTVLPDAPRARDHFQAALLDGRIVAAGGRTTSASTKQTFELTIAEVDAYDLAGGSWETLTADLPTPRAGCAALSHGNRMIVVGGESSAQQAAHNEVEVFSFDTGSWQSGTPLKQGRHGFGVCLVEGTLYVASGNGNRGGGAKLNDIEQIDVSQVVPE